MGGNESDAVIPDFETSIANLHSWWQTPQNSKDKLDIFKKTSILIEFTLNLRVSELLFSEKLVATKLILCL